MVHVIKHYDNEGIRNQHASKDERSFASYISLVQCTLPNEYGKIMYTSKRSDVD